MYSYQQFRKKFSEEITIHLTRRDELFKKKLQDLYREHRESWAYAEKLIKRGKRLRPFICYAMYCATGGKSFDKIKSQLVSLELLHLAFLVHDDIIDDGKIRHGVQTAHSFFAENINSRINIDRKHLGESYAILQGDILFYWSADIFDIGLKKFSASIGDAARRAYFEMVGETMLGEAIDIKLTTQKNTHTNNIICKNYFKTANYTFIRPLQIGAIFAGHGKRYDKFTEQFGAALGIAYQINDDLSDLITEPDKNNKDNFSDLRQGQHTLFTQYIFENGTQKEKKELGTLFGNTTLGKKDYTRIRTLFEGSGAIAYGRKKIEEYLNDADKALKKLPIKDKKINIDNIESVFTLIKKYIDI